LTPETPRKGNKRRRDAKETDRNEFLEDLKSSDRYDKLETRDRKKDARLIEKIESAGSACNADVVNFQPLRVEVVADFVASSGKSLNTSADARNDLLRLFNAPECGDLPCHTPVRQSKCIYSPLLDSQNKLKLRYVPDIPTTPPTPRSGKPIVKACRAKSTTMKYS